MNPAESGSSGDAWLLIDQGGHSSRAFVFDDTGRELASSVCPVGATRPRPGWVEQDALALLESVRSVIDEAVASVAGNMKIRAAGLATQRSSIAAWDTGTGQALGPVISWQDRRAAGWLEALEDLQPRIHELTGLVLSAHYGASKLRWSLDHNPAVASAAQSGTLAMGPLASYLLYGLLEERPFLTDPANASRTQLWDYREGDWSTELLGLFGVPRAVLPRCVTTRYPFGHLDTAGRRIPLLLTTGDQSAAAFAAPQSAPGGAFINIGTGAFLQIPAGEQPLSAPGLLSSVLYSDSEGTQFALEGTVNGAGSAVTFEARALGLEEDRVRASASQWLEQIQEPPLYLNGVGGLAAPYWLPQFESSFLGEGDPPSKMVAVLESIVFLLRVNLERAATRQPVHGIVVTGGLASLDGLCQRLADLCDAVVERPAFREATVLGLFNLLSGGGATAGEIDLQRFEPHPNKGLEGRFQRWQAAMDEATRAVPRRRNSENDPHRRA